MVGQSIPKVMRSKMYLVELVDSRGKSWTVWGYGVSSIMKSHVPDLMMLRKYFPHVPVEAFHGLAEKEVDILLGLNMNHLFPAGGKGKNRHQGIRAKTSLFDCGWVIGGCHRELSPDLVAFLLLLD